ncbi:MAG TPA: hypothetical protein DDX39_03815 [Bacteroidales bacterium]|nr:MAG: hypothetical protein A2W98_08975 [Bacteroidetes bacterium GWF2_33_38]OFY72748.1 MAG: hypothetical protein A2265_01775 [Bacteroidetes bacterium RIFOXYA12_FULL_33_9]OFY90128.1 MAG: hypothetical protein A2236_10135 [Bacteroidetes bacterium RIFOXYA2_FULL_33_7]HBF87748.1 hypothetical protein [Bacteroidales bacterium]
MEFVFYFCKELKNIYMLQRIQSIYLLLSAVFSGLIFMIPLAEYIDGASQVYELSFWKFQSLSAGAEISFLVYPIAFFAGLSTLLNLVSIFLFKKRVLQMRISVFTIIMLLALISFAAFYIFKFKSDLNADVAIGISSFFPLISIILTLLAFRGIARDENLVRSVDRIR